MNKHVRLLASVLFIVIIVLAAAITRFNSDSAKISVSSAEQPAVERIIDTSSDGSRIFKDSSGLTGIIDSSDRVVVYPEWNDIRFTQSSMCIAEKRIKSKLLYGCIDYEGNITVPFVYSSIEPVKFPNRTLYFAKAADNGSYAVYDLNFSPCFAETWRSFKTSGDNLTLSTENGSYLYAVKEDGLIFREATVDGFVMQKKFPFSFELKKEKYLAKLTPQILEAISRDIKKYVEFAFSGGTEFPELSESSQIETLFPNETGLSCSLKKLSDILVTHVSSDGDTIKAEVSLTVETDVNYTANGRPVQLHEKCRADLAFSGSTSADFHIISGKFSNKKPNYPKAEPEDEQDE